MAKEQDCRTNFKVYFIILVCLFVLQINGNANQFTDQDSSLTTSKTANPILSQKANINSMSPDELTAYIDIVFDLDVIPEDIISEINIAVVKIENNKINVNNLVNSSKQESTFTKVEFINKLQQKILKTDHPDFPIPDLKPLSPIRFVRLIQIEPSPLVRDLQEIERKMDLKALSQLKKQREYIGLNLVPNADPGLLEQDQVSAPSQKKELLPLENIVVMNKVSTRKNLLAEQFREPATRIIELQPIAAIPPPVLSNESRIKTTNMKIVPLKNMALLNKEFQNSPPLNIQIKKSGKLILMERFINIDQFVTELETEIVFPKELKALEKQPLVNSGEIKETVLNNENTVINNKQEVLTGKTNFTNVAFIPTTTVILKNQKTGTSTQPQKIPLVPNNEKHASLYSIKNKQIYLEDFHPEDQDDQIVLNSENWRRAEHKVAMELFPIENLYIIEKKEGLALIKTLAKTKEISSLHFFAKRTTKLEETIQQLLQPTPLFVSLNSSLPFYASENCEQIGNLKHSFVFKDTLSFQNLMDSTITRNTVLNTSRPLSHKDSLLLGIPSSNYYQSWETNKLFPYEDRLKMSRDTSITLTILGNEHCTYTHPFNGPITSNFGWRDSSMHTGIDIDLIKGDKVAAAFDGMVRLGRTYGGYGKVVIIRHYNGLETVYAHLSKILVKPGQLVESGDIIGLGGNTGHSTGSHLHFELRFKGMAINPKYLILLSEQKLMCSEYTLKQTKYGLAVYPKDSETYTVVRGDNVYEIARRFGTTTTTIKELNHLNSTWARLKVGMQINVKR